jgi:uncharacterized repeat protein (TIGR01451 family)
VAGSSLTGVFAPGAPALIESLRTLVVTPQRVIAPGEIVKTTFAFSNLGGAAATGVRVRFALPTGVTHQTDSDVIDDRPLTDAHFVDADGAPVGDLEPGSQRTVSCSFRVHDTIEDGTELVFQVALVAAETPLVASNIERVGVRSRPVLQNAQTLVTIAAPDHPKPESVLTVRATISNTGSSSANDVVALLPAPDRTRYIARSARIGGRILPNAEGEAFDYDAGTIVAEHLAPGQSVVVEFQVAVDAPLPDGTRVRALGTIASRECAEFEIASADVAIESPVEFENEETTLKVFCDDVVTPGMRIPLSLRATNTGTGEAGLAAVSFDLPAGLVYAPGSAHVDGQPVADDTINGLSFALGTLAAERTVEVGFAATVAVPLGDDNALPIHATLRWKNGSRAFIRTLHVRVAPRFNRARNYVETDRGTAHAREDVRFVVHVYNDGTAAERNVRLRVIPGAYLENVRVAESSDEPVTYGEPLDLGIIVPHAERRFVVVARVASPVPDRSHVNLGAVLEHDGGSIDLGTATFVVRSRPQIARESVAWELTSHEPLRPHRTAEIVVRFTNEGSDVLRDARLALQLPADLAIERAVEARRERDGLAFGDIPAHATHEARVTLRLLRPVKRGTLLALEGWLHGHGISPVQFAPLEVPTLAESLFDAASFHVAPTETINAGDRALYEIHLRNDGDGPADRLLVRVVPTNLAVYVPGSTSINGLPIPDDAGMSQLWSQRGVALADVTPGLDLRLRYEMIVMSPLAAGTAIDARAVLEWDDGKTVAIAAPTLRVIAQPTLAETSAGTPISIARTFPSDAPAYEPPAPVDPDPRGAQPETIEMGPRALADVIARAQIAVDRAPEPIVPSAPATPADAPIGFVEFDPERLGQTLSLIERSDAGGLMQHAFAMRMLFPQDAMGASDDLTRLFGEAQRTLRAPMERLFVRLRMPRLTVTGKDLEDREGRDALRALVNELLADPPARSYDRPTGLVRLQGPVNLDAIRALMPSLETEPLGAVTPWLINGQLLGTAIVAGSTHSDLLGQYRSELLGVLAKLSELPMPEFHRVLTSSVNRTLDEALAAVLDVLRAAAHLAVE